MVGLVKAHRARACFRIPPTAYRGLLAEPGVLVSGEKGIAALPEADMGVHAGPVVGEKGLGHEGDGLVVSFGHVLDDVLEPHELVAHLDQGLELHVDFRLTGRSHLVMLAFHFHAELSPGSGPFRCAGPAGCRWAKPGNSLLCGGVCSPGWDFLPGRCSNSFDRVDLIKAVVGAVRRSGCRQK